ncbi:energy transducer TonB family protein [Paralimibaculum aggregatum]|uniref:energy transducer TonB family protein n=1 Tax=Paralimibaculum aggregatum TaxID=3036245 RepID=UPI00331BF2B2
MQRDYLTRLARYLARHKRYPQAAWARRQEGTGHLLFAIDAAGRVTAAELRRSSGHGLLDREILALIERAAPLPAIPPELGVSRLEVVLPITFRIE